MESSSSLEVVGLSCLDGLDLVVMVVQIVMRMRFNAGKVGDDGSPDKVSCGRGEGVYRVFGPRPATWASWIAMSSGGGGGGSGGGFGVGGVSGVVLAPGVPSLVGMWTVNWAPASPSAYRTRIWGLAYCV